MNKMRNLIKATLTIVGLVLLLSATAAAQKLPKTIHIQAQAMGEQQQLGQSFSLNLIIEEFSTPEDQQALQTAFNAKQNEGLVNALDKMHSKGRMSITGTLGYEVTYIRQWKEPDGSTKYRMVTDRPITFGEAWSDSRSTEYSISGVEIIISPDKKKSTGTLMPLVKLKLNKENQLELETYQNPWKLVDVLLR